MRQTSLMPLAGSVILVALPALAQTAAPNSAAAGTGGSSSWLWLLVLLAVIAAAAWYFGYARNRSRTTSTMGIDRDRIAGSAEQAKGSLKEGVGSVLGDTKLQAEGPSRSGRGQGPEHGGRHQGRPPGQVSPRRVHDR